MECVCASYCYSRETVAKLVQKFYYFENLHLLSRATILESVHAFDKEVSIQKSLIVD